MLRAGTASGWLVHDELAQKMNADALRRTKILFGAEHRLIKKVDHQGGDHADPYREQDAVPHDMSYMKAHHAENR